MHAGPRLGRDALTPVKEYGYRARIAYRERCPRDEVLEEFRKWRESIGK